MPSMSIFKPSIGCVATILCALNLITSLIGLYRLMNPLSGYGDISMMPKVQPKWNVVVNDNDQYHQGDGDLIDMSAYISLKDSIGMEDIIEAHEFEHYLVYGPEYEEVEVAVENEHEDNKEVNTIITEQVPIHLNEPSTRILFDGRTNGGSLRPLHTDEDILNGIVFQIQVKTTTKIEESSLSGETGTCSAGAIECPTMDAKKFFVRSLDKSSIGNDEKSLLDGSVLIAAYQYARKLILGDDETAISSEPIVRLLNFDKNGPVWKALTRNGTVHVHVLLFQRDENSTEALTSLRLDDRTSMLTSLRKEVAEKSKSHAVILGKVSMIKQTPIVKKRPTRKLYLDLLYLYQKYFLEEEVGDEPWIYPEVDNEVFNTQDERAPHWKPEVAVKIVPDQDNYPVELAQKLGMSLVQGWTKEGATYYYLPSLHVDEIGLTSEKYIPLNETVASLPLKLSFGDLSPQRWRLISHLGGILEQSRTNPEAAGLLGQVEDSDIDDIRMLIADTNVTLLLFTLLMSTLHLLFEFLAFKSDVDFWKDTTLADGTKSKKRLAGLSVRSLFIDLVCQIVILLYLIEAESTLLMIVPQIVSVLIAAWKCSKAVGRMKNVEKDSKESDTALDELDRITEEIDRKATSTLAILFTPVLIAFSLRSIIVDEHHSWYSWFISTASGSVYTFGFILMTPQLFLNYKLKSVAHMPWRVLCYKFINTFIDDLFVFIIRMPTMARLSAFRDDIVFIIYMFQRYFYKVDKDRPAEGIGGENNDDK